MHFVLQMKSNADIRQIFAKGQRLDDFRRGVDLVKERFEAFHSGEKEFEKPDELKTFTMRALPWICQPYQRPPPEVHLKKVEEIRAKEKRQREQEDEKENGAEESGQMSKRKQKKLEKNPNKKFPHNRKGCAICETCPNPKGMKCEYCMCRQCCRSKCYREELDCSGHRILVKSKREAARRYKAERDEANPVEVKDQGE